MNCESVVVNANGMTICINVIKKKVKRITLKIGSYNKEYKTYDAILTLPNARIKIDPTEVFLSHFKWYLSKASQLDKTRLEDGYTYLNGEVVTLDEAKKSRDVVLDYVNYRFTEYQSEFGIRNINIRFRNMKSRWGSYNRVTNTVTFSFAILRLPNYLIDYIICHELTHYYYFNHSKDFYAKLGTVYPNYKSAGKELKMYS